MVSTMNCGAGNVFKINIPDHARTAARRTRNCGVKAELEVFDLGHLVLANKLVAKTRLIIENLGARLLTAAETRARLGISP